MQSSNKSIGYIPEGNEMSTYKIHLHFYTDLSTIYKSEDMDSIKYPSVDEGIKTRSAHKQWSID